jgi:hypothetical protein
MDDRRSHVASLQRAAVHGFAFLVVCALSYAVYMTPLNVNDFLKHLFLFETRSLSNTFYRELINSTGGADWRPLQLPSAQLVYELLARGHEHLVFKGMLIGFLALTVGLVLRLIDVRSWSDVLAAAIALLVLLGHHTFGGTVEGVYPYGVEIVLLACELAVLNILMRVRASLASEILAFAIAIFAILLNEKGGFVGVTYIVGALLRLPGGTVRCAGIVFAAYVAVMCFRFWVAPMGGVMDRSEGQGYLGKIYDAAAPILNLLISDPRLGRFATIPQAMMGKPWALLYLTSSLLLTGLIAAWAWATAKRTDETARQELKILAIFVVVLLGSAMFGPFSRKDYIPVMALAGYALVSFYALKWFFAETLQAKRPATYAVLAVLAAGLAVSWSIRTAGLVYYLRELSFAYQREWAFGIDVLARTHEFSPAITQPIIARLRPQGLSPPLNDPRLVFPKPITHLMRGRSCPEVCQP